MPSWEQLAEAADKATEQGNIKECHSILSKANADGVHHPQLTWRYARSFYETAEESSNKAQREKDFREGLEYAKKAVEEDSNNFAAHKWCGVLLSAQNEFLSSKEKIANAYAIRDYFLKATELKPDDPTSQHCMGMWCWNVLQISWMERQAASLLFGSPPTSTNEECLKYLLAADAGPTIRNSLAVGDVYVQMKKKDEAKKWYQKAVDMPATTELQKRYHAVAEKKLKSC